MRTRFQSTDPDEEWTYLRHLYGAEFKTTSDIGPIRCNHLSLGPIFVDDVEIGVGVKAAADDVAWIMAGDFVRGHGTLRSNGASHEVGPGSLVPVCTPGQPVAADMSGLRERVVGLTPGEVDRAVHERGDGEQRGPFRFTDFAPLDRAAATTWRTMIDHVVRLADANPRVFRQPQATASLGRVVAHTMLLMFPNSTWVEPSELARARDSGDGDATAVRRAMAFMEGAADTDITLADVAQAVHVTPRALQYGFRRQLGTTPMAYLRTVRLQQARAELLAALAGTTVTQVAGRWGFYNLGRFAGYYRAEFGESPAQTLAGLEPDDGEDDAD